VGDLTTIRLMFKIPIIVTALLPTLALAQQLSQPPKPGQWCPMAWIGSGNYCAPDKAPQTIPRNGWCPAGWRESGSYCIR